MLKKLTLIGLSAATAFAMHSVELNINDKDLELGAKLDMGQFNHTVEPNTVFVGMKFLKADKDHSKPKDADIKDYYELNFLMQRKIDNTGLVVGLGVKLNHTEKFTTVPLGVEVKYKLPFTNTVPFYIGGSVYYAPQVLSMSDAKNYLEQRVQLDIEVIQNATIIVGARNIETNYDISGSTHDFRYNRSAYVGFRFAF